jgi:phosphoinositide-3-kinase, regulatory subunit 4
VKLWHHSRAAPITRLATSFVPPPQMWGSRNVDISSVRPYVFASSGPNECAMFDVTTGNCAQCFRTVGFGSHSGHGYAEDIPILQEVPISAASTRRSALMTNGFLKNHHVTASSPVTSINAMCGSIGVSDHSYLMTGGGDARIRFWDFAVPSKCFVVSGHSSVQPRPSFERIDLEGPCRLMLCRQLPSTGKIGGSSKFVKKLGKGLSKPENHHTEAIQDLKIVNKALISASRDCTVKVWR